MKKLYSLKRSLAPTIITSSTSNNEDNRHVFYQRLHNMTNINFDNNETALLEKGLKLNIKPKSDRKQTIKHILNVENAILKTNPAHQDEIRTLFISHLNRNRGTTHHHCNNKKPDTKTIATILQKIDDNDAIVMKADKGNTTVVINKDEYNTKIEQYITDNNILMLRNDPTKNYLKNINSLISKSTHLLNRYQIRRNKMMKPSAPVITGLPKIHKPNVPIRPLINFTTSPTYKIAKTLNKWLTQHITLRDDWSLKNNIELVDKIRNVHIPNGAKFASFDVTNMYTNIPVTDTLNITRNLLIDRDIDLMKVNDVINLLEMITSQNYFQHNNKFYTQRDGLAMGSPLSGTLADIYLNYFERMHVHHNQNKFKNNIIYWHRYVDDVLLLFRGTTRQLNSLHRYINNIHNNISFTLEMETTEKTINFLDLTISNVNQNHQFNIYRKSTQTDHTIHNSSYHPFQHKIAAYRHLIHRLNSIPMDENHYIMELNTIIDIAVKNGFTEKLVRNLNKKHRNKISRHNLSSLYIDQNNEKQYISIEYNHNTNNILQTILHRFGYNIAYQTKNKLHNKLKPKQNVIDSGIYKLVCNDCDCFYVGQTGRTFAQRFAEHTNELNNIMTNTLIKSNYAQHLFIEKHTFSNINQNLRILYRMPKGNIMDRYEEYVIYKNRHNVNLLNDKINSKTNKLYELILGKFSF